MKDFLKSIVSRTPYRVTRNRGAYRFDGIAEGLRHLQNLGYAPRVVIDGGAHTGDFALKACALFSDAAFHLIEPQPACASALGSLVESHKFVFHPAALAARSGQLPLHIADGPNTGANIGESESSVLVPSITLDELFPCLSIADRALLKLDLQGYEMEALLGGEHVLSVAEVVLTEVSFFRQAYEPSIAELIGFLAARDFELFDVAALSARFRDNRLRQGDFIFVRSGSALAADTSWE